MTSGVTAGVNISYDEAFETRVSADIKVRFGGASTTAQRKEVQQLPVINALTSTPAKRDVRVHDFRLFGSGKKQYGSSKVSYYTRQIEEKYSEGDKCTRDSPGVKELGKRDVSINAYMEPVFFCSGGVLVRNPEGGKKLPKSPLN